MQLPPYESVIAYLSEPSFNGGMEAYYDFLPLLVALLRNEQGVASPQRLAELARYLTDEQRHSLHQLAAAANRLDDATISAEINETQYQAQRTRRFGTHNPERMDIPFWTFMVQRGWIAYQARIQFDRAYRHYMDAYRARREREEAGRARNDEPELPHPGYGEPIWCFSRFGMTRTRLPDGRVAFIAGEHEDFYDPDFCIYNDVVVMDPELRVTIYGYPHDLFPPTDFHTATLVGQDSIYVIGNLGYIEKRQVGTTPLYRLDTSTMQITAIDTSGTPPGWISRHSADYDPTRNAIKVTGGQVFTGNRSLRNNGRTFWLNLTTMEWSHRKPSLAKE